MTGPATTVARIHRGLAVLDATDSPDARWLAEIVRQCLAGAPWERACASRWWLEEQDAALARLVAALGPFRPAGKPGPPWRAS